MGVLTGIVVIIADLEIGATCAGHGTTLHLEGGGR